MNRHTRYRPATTTRNTATQWSRRSVDSSEIVAANSRRWNRISENTRGLGLDEECCVDLCALRRRDALPLGTSERRDGEASSSLGLLLLSLVRGDRPRPSLLAQPLLFVIHTHTTNSYSLHTPLPRRRCLLPATPLPRRRLNTRNPPSG